MTPAKTFKAEGMRAVLIAPCGMNCRLCIAYRREKNACPGCRADDCNKPITRSRCRIKTCRTLARSRARYCGCCDSFPCASLMHLDRRYRDRYGMSMIENLENLRKVGVRKFLKDEQAKWTCPGCGDILCVHRPQCLLCDYTRPQRKGL